ncbi:MAG: hypothetical protein ACTHJ7_01250, partial [Candidatus Nitrosocosmicus sp.]
FSMTFAPSIMQMDKVFALDLGSLFNSGSSSSSSGSPLKSLLGDALNVANGGSSSSSSPSNLLKDLFGGGKSSNTPDNNSPNNKDSPKSSDSGDSGNCIRSKDTGTKDYYCAGTHHHCVEGKSPGCIFEGGRKH